MDAVCLSVRLSICPSVLVQADIIIDETYTYATGNFEKLEDFLKAHGITSAAAAGIKAITNRQVYTLAGTTGKVIERSGPSVGTVGLDWFERGTTRCDEVRPKGAFKTLLMFDG